MAQEPRKINVKAPSQSKISSLELFPGHAEVTRVLPVSLEEGLTQVIISGLPNDLRPDTLRITNPEDAKILTSTCAVSVARREPCTDIRHLEAQKKLVKEGLDRCKLTKESLEKYFGSIDVNSLEGSHLENTLDSHRRAFDKTAKERQDFEEEMEEVEKSLAFATEQDRLQGIIEATIYAPESGETGLSVTYVVPGVDWKVKYLIHVSRDEAGSGWQDTASLSFLITVSNTTGERWTDMAYIRTHSVTPSFESPLSLSSHWIHRNNDVLETALNAAVDGNTFFLDQGKPISIPSNDDYHEITLGTIQMNAAVSLFVKPEDERVYLKGRFKNSSAWALTPGVARVFIDSHFVNQAQIGEVSAGEYFDCPLKLETGIVVSYHHPQEEKILARGTYTHKETRTIQITNRRSTQVNNIYVIDNWGRKGQDVKCDLFQPPLSTGSQEKVTIADEKDPLRHVYAQWDEQLVAGDPNDRMQSLEQEGRIRWVCSLGPKAQVLLVLRWQWSNPIR